MSTSSRTNVRQNPAAGRLHPREGLLGMYAPVSLSLEETLEKRSPLVGEWQCERLGCWLLVDNQLSIVYHGQYGNKGRYLNN